MANARQHRIPHAQQTDQVPQAPHMYADAIVNAQPRPNEPLPPRQRPNERDMRAKRRDAPPLYSSQLNNHPGLQREFVGEQLIIRLQHGMIVSRDERNIEVEIREGAVYMAIGNNPEEIVPRKIGFFRPVPANRALTLRCIGHRNELVKISVRWP